MATDKHTSILSGRYHANELNIDLHAAYWLFSSGDPDTGRYLLRQALETFAVLSKHMEVAKALLSEELEKAA